MGKSPSEQEGRSAVDQEKKSVQKREEEEELVRLAQAEPKSNRKDLKKGIVFGNPKEQSLKEPSDQNQLRQFRIEGTTPLSEFWPNSTTYLVRATKYYSLVPRVAQTQDP
ncbi:hypothetical protein PVK06_001967 [Gossypium arboreum]|uniref:Uncharacterized protein n=1 Tax=Gossypium arboreum TaxID=29729 RepID=A0ABR0R3G3_GOSAR|nr:hypothetical protein PVK06_001967 [Gossypium arboreum]